MPATISGLRPVWSESQPVSELAGAPDGRVDGGDDRDLAHAGAVRGEVERREAPGERVVEVVDEPGLRAGAQHRVARDVACDERAAAARMRRPSCAVVALLERDVRAGVAHERDTRRAAR